MNGLFTFDKINGSTVHFCDLKVRRVKIENKAVKNVKKEVIKFRKFQKKKNTQKKKNFGKQKKYFAPAGNRTRVCTVAGYYSTTRPLVLVEVLAVINYI